MAGVPEPLVFGIEKYSAPKIGPEKRPLFGVGSKSPNVSQFDKKKLETWVPAAKYEHWDWKKLNMASGLHKGRFGKYRKITSTEQIYKDNKGGPSVHTYKTFHAKQSKVRGCMSL